MHGRSVSTVTAYTAHREWATRPPDERYASVQALADAARARRHRTDARITETVDLRVQAPTSDSLVIDDRSRPPAALTHWSFEQLAGLAGAPPAYLRTLPAPIAADAINYGLQGAGRAEHQLFAERAEPWTLHAITSPRYARVHHDELADRVLDLMAQHPAWHLPLGYKDGVMGAERVPSGAYLGDRDMFLFLVDGNRNLDDPTDGSQAGLFRGFMLRNSDVGAAALSLDLFLFRAVCGNHIIWGFHHVAGFRRRHVGASIHDAWTHSLREVRAALDADLASDRTTLLRATLPGDRRDARGGDRLGRAATGLVAQARGRRLHDGGAARDKPEIRLGLCAGADTTQSAHALAGFAARSRQSCQPPARFGPLTVAIVAARAQPARSFPQIARARS